MPTMYTFWQIGPTEIKSNGKQKINHGLFGVVTSTMEKVGALGLQTIIGTFTLKEQTHPVPLTIWNGNMAQITKK